MQRASIDISGAGDHTVIPGVAYAWQAAVIGGGILAAKIIHGAAIMIMRIA